MRRFAVDERFVIVLLMVIGLVSFAQRCANAQITVTTNNKHFSGTNCRIYVTSWATGHLLISSTKVTINGVEVENIIWPANKQYGEAIVHFDSTHWPDGTLLTVVTTNFYSDGSAKSASFKIPTYNQAYVLGNQVLKYGTTAATDVSRLIRSVGIGDSYGMRSAVSDNKQNIGILLPAYSVFYAWTHTQWKTDVLLHVQVAAMADCFGSDLDNNVNFNLHWLVGTQNTDFTGPWMRPQIDLKLQGKVYPEYQFVFLDSCGAAYNDVFAQAFRCSRAVDANLAGRAFLGWNNNAPDRIEYEAWTQSLYRNMVNGKPLKEAIVAADNEWRPTMDAKLPQFRSLRPVIRGEELTSLRGVFDQNGMRDQVDQHRTQVTVSPNRWHRYEIIKVRTLY